MSKQDDALRLIQRAQNMLTDATKFLQPEEPAAPQRWVFNNFWHHRQSGGQQVFSADGQIALMAMRDDDVTGARRLDWVLFDLVNDRLPHVVGNRNTSGGKNADFMWGGRGGDFLLLGHGRQLLFRDRGEIKHSRTLGDDFRYESGTGSGVMPQPILRHRLDGQLVSVDLVNRELETVASWPRSANYRRIKSILPHAGGYYFTPQIELEDGTIDQSQTYSVDHDGANLMRLETPDGVPPAQSWTHEFLADGKLWTGLIGRGIGMIDIDGTQVNELLMIPSTRTAEACDRPRAFRLWFQHGHGAADGAGFIYSAVDWDSRHDGEVDQFILWYDIQGDELKLIDGPIRTWYGPHDGEHGFTFFTRPSVSVPIDGRRFVAYQRNKSVVVQEMPRGL